MQIKMKNMHIIYPKIFELHLKGCHFILVLLCRKHSQKKEMAIYSNITKLHCAALCQAAFTEYNPILNKFSICEEYLHIFKQTFAYCKTEDLLPSALLVVKQMHRAYNAWRNCSKAGLWLKWQIVYLICVHYRHRRSLSSHWEN